jgi:hypothetical protein
LPFITPVLTDSISPQCRQLSRSSWDKPKSLSLSPVFSCLQTAGTRLLLLELTRLQIFFTLPSFQLPTNCRYYHFFYWNSLDCASLTRNKNSATAT